jgi:hypothetical protein
VSNSEEQATSPANSLTPSRSEGDEEQAPIYHLNAKALANNRLGVAKGQVGDRLLPHAEIARRVLRQLSESRDAENTSPKGSSE